MSLHYRHYYHILFLLMIYVSFLSCGNLLNEEAITSPSDINEPVLSNDINTFFNKTFSTSAALNIQTKYDEYVISGSPVGEENIEEIWIASLDLSGKLIFESTIRTGKHVRVAAQITDNDRNYIFICNEFDPTTYRADIIILKISYDKKVKWMHRLGSDTSIFALSAALLSGGIIAITSQSENIETQKFDPVLIKIDPVNYLISSIKIDYQVPTLSGNVYPVPVKIISYDNDSLTIAGYYFDYSTRSKIAVLKIDSDNKVISKYILFEPAKNLSILDIIYQNPVYDILLLCKSDTLHGRDEGFTLLKVFKNSTIKFENDYIINGFTISDNIINMNNESFSVGGYSYNDTGDYSVSAIVFNYSGNIKSFQNIEPGITGINRIVFSTEVKNNSLSYIYSCKKINDYNENKLISRRITLAGLFKKSEESVTISNSLKSNGETLNPVAIDDITVKTENLNNIFFKSATDLNIEWK